MASEELRAKWGTVFMGERETSMEKLDAMQEPLLRERHKREQQEEYLETVRKKAADRAREILGAAYTERQKVLEEAKAEGETCRQKFIEEGQRLKTESKTAHDEIVAELAKAKAAREEAEQIRDAAYGEGFQAGMDQAGAELKEFRADLGLSLSKVLCGIDEQRKIIFAGWREEIAELVQTAVAAGTGWVLENEHNRILHTLTLNALSLLEDRATVTVRVNPADEAQIGDLFAAARERAPELTQWIVNGDETIESGGLTAESVSGSVDCRREHFREMVINILMHLTLPERDDEDGKAHELHEQIEQEVAKLAAYMPEPDVVPEAQPEPEAEQDTVDPQPEPEPETEIGQNMTAEPQQSEPEPEPEAEQTPQIEPVIEFAHVPETDPVSEPVPVEAVSEVEQMPASDAEPDSAPAVDQDIALDTEHLASSSQDNPTLEELEEELLPLENGVKI